MNASLFSSFWGLTRRGRRKNEKNFTTEDRENTEGVREEVQELEDNSYKQREAFGLRRFPALFYMSEKH